MSHLLFFDFGTGEIFIIVLAILLVFGPGKIPELARGMGKFVREIKKASDEVRREINKEADRQEREEKLRKYQEKAAQTVNDNIKSAKDQYSSVADDEEVLDGEEKTSEKSDQKEEKKSSKKQENKSD